MSKIKVEVFNGENPHAGACGGCAGCGGGCSPSDIKQMYEQLVSELSQKLGADKVDFKYIEADEKSLSDYPDVDKVLQMGYGFPITAIDGQPVLAGGLSSDAVLEAINRLSENQ